MPRICLMPAIYASYCTRMHLRDPKSQNFRGHIPRARCEIFDQNNYSTVTPIV